MFFGHSAGRSEDIVRAKRKTAQGGYSLVETMIAMAITTVMIVIIFSMIEEAMTLSLFVESHNDLSSMSQRALNAIQTEVLQSRQIFREDGGVGTAYRTAIQAPGLLPACVYPCASSIWRLPPVAATRLADIDPAATLAPDPAGTSFTGNALLLARQLIPLQVPVIADPGNAVSFPAFTFYADRYRFEYFYLTKRGSPSHRTFRNGDHIADLYQVRTIEYADYFQLANATANMSAAQKTDLGSKLRGLIAGAPSLLKTAWNPGQAIGAAFWNVDRDLIFPPAGQLTTFAFDSSQAAASGGDLASGGSLMPALLAGRIGGKMDYTVAYVLNQDPSPDIRLLSSVPQNELRTNGRNPMPQYGQIAATLPLDCGLEVKIAGPTGSRQILTRLVMYSNYRASKVDSAEAFVITSFSGLLN